jgi:hypothetical protein
MLPPNGMLAPSAMPPVFACHAINHRFHRFSQIAKHSFVQVQARVARFACDCEGETTEEMRTQTSDRGFSFLRSSLLRGRPQSGRRWPFSIGENR